MITWLPYASVRACHARERVHTITTRAFGRAGRRPRPGWASES